MMHEVGMIIWYYVPKYLKEHVADVNREGISSKEEVDGKV